MAEKNNKTILAIVIVVVALIIVVAAALVLTKNNGGSTTAAATASAGTGTATPAPTHTNITIRVAGYWGAGGLTTNEPLLLAQHLGYLPSYIAVQDTEVQVGAAGIAAIASGKVDAAHVQWNTLIRAEVAGTKLISVVLAHGAESTTNWHLFVKNGSSIRSAADLKGKKIGGVIIGDTSEIAFQEFLKQANLTEADVTLVTVPFGQEKQVLDAGQVDGVGVWSDFTNAMMEASPNYRVVFTIYDTIPAGLHHCGIVFSKKFVDENPDVIKDIVTSVVKANEWSKNHTAEAKQFYIDLAKQRNVNSTLIELYMKNNDIRQYSLIESSDLQYYADWLVKSGEISPGQAKISEYYTNKYNPYYTGGP